MNFSRYRLPIAVAVLVVLGAGAAIALSGRDASTHDDETTGVLPSLERDAITKLEITRPGETPIRLERVDGQWRVTAPLSSATDESAVRTALDKLSSLEAKSIAATREGSHEVLEVDAAKGIHVIAYGGDDTLADLYVGTTRGGNTMVRVEGEAAVVAAAGSIRYAFDRALPEWRDREILDVDPKTVAAIDFAFGDESLRFERSGEEWKPADKQAPIERFSSAKVSALVSTLARLRASSFAAPELDAATAGLETPSATVTLTLAAPAADAGVADAARTVVLRLGGAVEGAQERYLSREGDPLIYTVTSYVADRMTPEAGLLSEPEPGTEPPAAAPVDMPGGGEGIPPELMEQIQRQLQQAGH